MKKVGSWVYSLYLQNHFPRTTWCCSISWLPASHNRTYDCQVDKWVVFFDCQSSSVALAVEYFYVIFNHSNPKAGIKFLIWFQNEIPFLSACMWSQIRSWSENSLRTKRPKETFGPGSTVQNERIKQYKQNKSTKPAVRILELSMFPWISEPSSFEETLLVK